MKTTIYSFFILIVALLSACAPASQNSVPKNAVATNTQPSPVPTNTQAKDGDYQAKGKITKIDNNLGSVELDHEEIPGLMPKMVMEFFVADKAMLKEISVGDNVDFVIKYDKGTETITSIKKLP